MPTRTSGEKYRNTTVSIDSYENDVLCGTVYNPFFEAPRPFRSTMQLIRLMEDAFDEMKYPQSYTAMRTFQKRVEEEAESAPQVRGALATFRIRILFRQNASWQGEVIWQDGGATESFRSVLELLLLMDSALHH